MKFRCSESILELKNAMLSNYQVQADLQTKKFCLNFPRKGYFAGGSIWISTERTNTWKPTRTIAFYPSNSNETFSNFNNMVFSSSRIDSENMNFLIPRRSTESNLVNMFINNNSCLIILSPSWELRLDLLFWALSKNISDRSLEFSCPLSPIFELLYS